MSLIPGQGYKNGLMVVVDHPNGSQRSYSSHLPQGELKLLNAVLKSVGVTKYYITYAYPYPEDVIEADKFDMDQVALARQWLESEVADVEPQRIFCLGSLGASAILGVRRSISKIHGFSCMFEGVFTVFSYPPYVINKDPDFFRDLANEANKFIIRNGQYKAPTIVKAVCKTPAQFSAGLALLNKFGSVSCDTETTGLEIDAHTIETIGFAGLDMAQNKVTAIICDAHIIDTREVKIAIQNFFRNYKGYVIFHNAKFDLQFIKKCFDVDLFSLHIRDTMLLNYMLDERPVNSKTAPHGLKTITRIRYDVPDYHFDFEGPEGWWATPDSHRDWAAFYRYLSWDIAYTIILYTDLLHDIADERGEDYEKVMYLYDELLIPGTVALSLLEMNGAPIDVDYFTKLRIKYDALLADIYTNCNKLVYEITDGRVESINIGSTQQLGRILYADLLLPSIKTRKGSDSTAKEALETLRELLPSFNMTDERKDAATRFLDEILRFRAISKAQSTYVVGMVEQADSKNNLHTQYNQTGTSTGRLSAEKPALQTIPQATGLDIRKGFRAPLGWLFLKVDYNQLEYRSVAAQSHDEQMIEAYRQGRDIHIEIASMTLGIPREKVQKHERYLAKFIGFGLLYGRGAYSIANGPELRGNGIYWTERQAQDFIDQFLNQFPKLKAWMNKQKTDVIKNQYLETPVGRIRRWPYLTSKSAIEAKREALNFPVQSLASDVTMTALVEVSRMIRAKNYKTKPILIVHDEIDFIVPISEAVEIVPQIVDIMENVKPLGYQLACPLAVEPEFGPNWGTLYKWKDFNPETCHEFLVPAEVT